MQAQVPGEVAIATAAVENIAGVRRQVIQELPVPVPGVDFREAGAVSLVILTGKFLVKIDLGLVLLFQTTGCREVDYPLVY
jgi:hypothetical protein